MTYRQQLALAAFGPVVVAGFIALGAWILGLSVEATLPTLLPPPKGTLVRLPAVKSEPPAPTSFAPGRISPEDGATILAASGARERAAAGSSRPVLVYYWCDESGSYRYRPDVDAGSLEPLGGDVVAAFAKALAVHQEPAPQAAVLVLIASLEPDGTVLPGDESREEAAVAADRIRGRAEQQGLSALRTKAFDARAAAEKLRLAAAEFPLWIVAIGRKG